MANSAQVLTNEATTLGYDALSDRDLKECLLAIASAVTPTNSSAQTLTTLAASLNYDSLSQKGVTLALVGFYANATGITAKVAIATAAANFYGALSDYGLDQAILSVLA
jgi:hypothetical protein